MTAGELEAALRGQVTATWRAALATKGSIPSRELELRTSLLLAHAKAFAEAERVRERLAIAGQVDGAAGQGGP